MALLYAALRDGDSGSGGARVHINDYTFESHALRVVCPVCRTHLDPKQPIRSVHHFVHRPLVRCDPWRQTMTKWQKHWQACWAPERNEVPVERDGITHVADVVTADGVVVALQHSPLTREEVWEREEFYGNMAWVFDGGDKSQLELHGDSFIVFRFKCSGWAWARRPAFIDTPWGLYRITHQRVRQSEVVFARLVDDTSCIVSDRPTSPFYPVDAVPVTKDGGFGCRCDPSDLIVHGRPPKRRRWVFCSSGPDDQVVLGEGCCWMAKSCRPAP
jgi:hypothetical protein